MDNCVIRMFFNELVNQNGLPSGVYSKLEISDWCTENGIRLFESAREPGAYGKPEGVGDTLEFSLIYDILHLTTSKYKKWRQSWPNHFKGIAAHKKAENVEFRRLVYGSAFFQKDVRLIELLKKGMLTFNQQKQGITSSSVPNRVTIQNYFQRLFEEVLPAQRPLLQAIEISFLTQSRLELTLLEKIKNLEEEQRKNLNLIKE